MRPHRARLLFRCASAFAVVILMQLGARGQDANGDLARRLEAMEARLKALEADHASKVRELEARLGEARAEGSAERVEELEARVDELETELEGSSKLSPELRKWFDRLKILGFADVTFGAVDRKE